MKLTALQQIQLTRKNQYAAKKGVKKNALPWRFMRLKNLLNELREATAVQAQDDDFIYIRSAGNHANNNDYLCTRGRMQERGRGETGVREGRCGHENGVDDGI